MRAFIAVKVKANEKILSALNFLKNFDFVKRVEPENLHINVKFLGEISDQDYEKIKQVLDKISSLKLKELNLILKEVDAFPNKHHINTIVIMIECEELKRLYEFIEIELEKIGFNKEHRAFKAHLTLARVKRKPTDKIKEIFEIKDFGCFKAHDVELIKSVLTEKGPVYETIHLVRL